MEYTSYIFKECQITGFNNTNSIETWDDPSKDNDSTLVSLLKASTWNKSISDHVKRQISRQSLFYCLFNLISSAKPPYFRSLTLQSTCHWRRNVERHHGKFRDTTYKFISISIKPFSPRTFRVSFLYNYCDFQRRFPLHRLLQNDLELGEDDDFKYVFTDCRFRLVGILVLHLWSKMLIFLQRFGI